MKNLSTTILIAAAAIVSMAGTAAAQSLEAKIPFAFHANGKVLSPGTYRVTTISRTAGVPVISINSHETKQGVLAVALTDSYVKKDWLSAETAILSFQCSSSRCALQEIWMGGGEGPVYKLPNSKLDKDEPARVVEVIMQPVKAY